MIGSAREGGVSIKLEGAEISVIARNVDDVTAVILPFHLSRAECQQLIVLFDRVLGGGDDDTDPHGCTDPAPDPDNTSTTIVLWE